MCCGGFIGFHGNLSLPVKLSGVVWFWGVYEHLFGKTWIVEAQVGAKKDSLLVMGKRDSYKIQLQRIKYR